VRNEQKQIVELDPLTLAELRVGPEFGIDPMVVLVPNSHFAVVSEAQKGARVINLDSMKVEGTLDGFFVRESNHEGTMVSAINEARQELAFIDTRSWTVLESRPLPKVNRGVRRILAPNWKLFVAEPKPGLIEVRNVDPDGEYPVVAEFVARQRFLSDLAVSPDMRLLAACSESGYSYLWNTTDWKRVATLRGHARGIHGTSFSPDSRRNIAAGSDADAIKFWDTISYQEVLTLDCPGSMFSNAKMLDDGQTLIATSDNNSNPRLHVWRAPGWKEIAEAEAKEGQPEDQ
jgi:WD40 repeat protein